MNLYPIYYSHTLLFSFLNPTECNKMLEANTTKKRKYECQEQDERQKKMILIDQFQTEMDYLFYEWNSIHVVLESIRNAFTVKNVTPEYLNEVDKELGIAYDDLKSQVRQLERRLKKMSTQIHQQLLMQHQSPTTSK